jgi:hypothetical protein
MSLDFALTQFYRLVVDDLILMYDAYVFYNRFKKDKRSLKEFSEVGSFHRLLRVVNLLLP